MMSNSKLIMGVLSLVMLGTSITALVFAFMYSAHVNGGSCGDAIKQAVTSETEFEWLRDAVRTNASTFVSTNLVTLISLVLTAAMFSCCGACLTGVGGTTVKVFLTAVALTANALTVGACLVAVGKKPLRQLWAAVPAAQHVDALEVLADEDAHEPCHNLESRAFMVFIFSLVLLCAQLLTALVGHYLSCVGDNDGSRMLEDHDGRHYPLPPHAHATVSAGAGYMPMHQSGPGPAPHVYAAPTYAPAQSYTMHVGRSCRARKV